MGFGNGRGFGFGRGRGYGYGRGIGEGKGEGKGGISGFSCVKFVFFAFNVLFWVSDYFLVVVYMFIRL